MAQQRRGARRSSSARGGSAEEPESMEEGFVEVEIQDLQNFTSSINIILYGPSGHGKTTLAAGAPNATLLSTEPGAVAAKRAGHTGNLIYAPTWPHVVAGLKVAEKKLGPDDWLIVDSASKMQQLQLRWILETKHEQNSRRDLDIPAIQDHQKWQNMFLRFISKIMDAPYNSILVATSMIKDDEEGETIVLPNIVGKDYTICMNFCAEADMVLYYAVSKTASTEKKTVRRILAQPYPPYFAKDRYHCLGKRYDVAEGEYHAMADIIERIEVSGYEE
jgi:hypothetical protein